MAWQRIGVWDKCFPRQSESGGPLHQRTRQNLRRLSDRADLYLYRHGDARRTDPQASILVQRHFRVSICTNWKVDWPAAQSAATAADECHPVTEAQAELGSKLNPPSQPILSGGPADPGQRPAPSRQPRNAPPLSEVHRTGWIQCSAVVEYLSQLPLRVSARCRDQESVRQHGAEGLVRQDQLPILRD